MLGDQNGFGQILMLPAGRSKVIGFCQERPTWNACLSAYMASSALTKTSLKQVSFPGSKTEMPFEMESVRPGAAGVSLEAATAASTFAMSAVISSLDL